MKKRIAVVGAGISGITSAYFFADKGYQVTLIDTDETPGGLLRSISSEVGYFDYGTHVGSKTGVDELDQFLFSGLAIDFHKFTTGHSGSFYKRLSQISPFINLNHLEQATYADLALSLIMQPYPSNEANLAEKFTSHYSPAVYNTVLADVIKKFFGVDGQELSKACYAFFDLNRVIAFSPSVSDNLKQLPLYSDRLGFHYATRGAEKFYPRTGGIGRWYQALLDKVTQQGVRLILGQPITSLRSNGESIDQLIIDDEAIDIDEIVWAVPSPILSRYLSLSVNIEKPRYRATALYHFAFNKPINSDCYYINVHEPSFVSGRLTIYQNLDLQETSTYRITVEALNDEDFDFNGAIDRVRDELIEMGLISSEHQCCYQDCQRLKQGFPVLTANIEQQLTQFNQSLTESFNNLHLLGRGSGNGFFMSDLLKQAYHLTREV